MATLLSPKDLFDKLVEASELSPIFARSSLARALRRAGVDADTLTPARLEAALPEIRRTLAPFVETRLDAAMLKIERLCKG